jgi:hypothetical protein
VFSYPYGTVLEGRERVRLSGDSIPDELFVQATVTLDYAVNPFTGERSEERFCWFTPPWRSGAVPAR